MQAWRICIWCVCTEEQWSQRTQFRFICCRGNTFHGSGETINKKHFSDNISSVLVRREIRFLCDKNEGEEIKPHKIQHVCVCVFLVRISKMFIKRALHAFEVMCTIWDILCMHIINTCAAWQRCESESFSTKWSASRERSKEICSCQGSARQRLLLEIFWKNHTFEGLVLCCLRISSSDQWNQKKKKKKKKKERGRTWVGEFWCWDGHGTIAFFFGDEPFTWSFTGRRRRRRTARVFLFWH